MLAFGNSEFVKKSLYAMRLTGGESIDFDPYSYVNKLIFKYYVI